MKTYDQLTETQKMQAINLEIDSLLTAILEGGIRFNDELNGDDLQARIDAAGEKANDMQTPWFASSYIMDTCKDDIFGMAQSTVENALYPDPDEYIIQLPVK